MVDEGFNGGHFSQALHEPCATRSSSVVSRPSGQSTCPRMHRGRDARRPALHVDPSPRRVHGRNVP